MTLDIARTALLRIMREGTSLGPSPEVAMTRPAQIAHNALTAIAIEARSGETVKQDSTEGESAAIAQTGGA